MPIIGISSFNRANYYAPADLNALNGSGNLEYDADYVIAAQYYAVNLVNEKGETTFKVKTERRRPAREIELSIVKGRKAETGGSVRLFYCPRNDFFRTAGDGTVFECEKEQGFRDNTKDLEKMNQALLNPSQIHNIRPLGMILIRVSCRAEMLRGSAASRPTIRNMRELSPEQHAGAAPLLWILLARRTDSESAAAAAGKAETKIRLWRLMTLSIRRRNEILFNKTGS